MVGFAGAAGPSFAPAALGGGEGCSPGRASAGGLSPFAAPASAGLLEEDACESAMGERLAWVAFYL